MESYSKGYMKWAPLAAFIFGVWFFCFRIIGLDMSYIPGDMGDSRFIHFILEHGHKWLIGIHENFWNAEFMYPYSDNVAFSDNLIGSFPIYSTFRFLGFESETSYQLWWVTNCSLNFWLSYWVLIKMFNRPLLATIGAFIFAFSIFHIGQLNFLQMSVRFMIPLGIYAAIKIVETGRVKYLALFTASALVQFLSVMYLGIFLIYFSIGLVVLYAVYSKKWNFFLPYFNKQNVVYTLLILASCGTIIILFTEPYRVMANQKGVILYPEAKTYLPTLMSYLNVSDSSLIWSWLPDMKNETWLHQNFLGIIPTLFVILSLPLICFKYTREKSNVLLLTITSTFLLLFLFFLNTTLGSLYIFPFQLPGMSSIRVINRFLHYELFLVILMILLILRNSSTTMLLIVFGLIIIDNSFDPNKVVRSNKALIQQKRVELIQKIEDNKKLSHRAFAIIGSNALENHLDAMTASLYTNLPTINGYSSSCPGDFGSFFLKTDSIGLNKWLKSNNIDKEEVLILNSRN